MKKSYLIKKTIERLSNLPQDIAIVVNYNDKKYSIIPEKFNYPLFVKNLTINDIKPFLFGEILEEQQEVFKLNPKYQFLTFRAELEIDVWSFALKCAENREQIQFHSFQSGDMPFLDGNYGKILAPSDLTLIEVKTLMWEIAENHQLSDVHILIESVDYPIFEGLRDRNSPKPTRLF